MAGEEGGGKEFGEGIQPFKDHCINIMASLMPHEICYVRITLLRTPEIERVDFSMFLSA
jgi:hypothetical protein